MVFDENKRKEIAQFILGNFEFGNLELFINSFAIRYLTLQATSKTECEEYKNLHTLFKRLNRYPRLNENNEIFWVREKRKKDNNKNQINNQVNKQNQFFKKKNINKSHNLHHEEALIQDIFWNFQKELDDLIFIFGGFNR